MVLFSLDVFGLFIQSNLKLDYSLTTKLNPMVKYTLVNFISILPFSVRSFVAENT